MKDKLNFTINDKCFIMADVAQAHDGSLGFAHAFIDAASKAGIDGIKFQTHIAEAESTPDEPWRVKFSLQDNTRYNYWKRMEFSEDQWLGLKDHATKVGLQFLSTPFSMEAFHLLNRIGVSAWKISSGEVTNEQLIKAMAQTGQPLILSSGMSSLSELDEAVNIIRKYNDDFAVLQCATAYPCPPEQVGLNMLKVFRQRYNCKVGLSDHSGTIYPSLAAVTLGAQTIEVHVTLSREMFGPDVLSSLTTSELKQLVEGIRFIENILRNPVNKDAVALEKKDLKIAFGKSIVAATDLSEGTFLSYENLALKKPGMGLGPKMLEYVIGRTLKKALKANQLLSKEDYE